MLEMDDTFSFVQLVQAKTFCPSILLMIIWSVSGRVKIDCLTIQQQQGIQVAFHLALGQFNLVFVGCGTLCSCCGQIDRWN